MSITFLFCFCFPNLSLNNSFTLITNDVNSVSEPNRVRVGSDPTIPHNQTLFTSKTNSCSGRLEQFGGSPFQTAGPCVFGGHGVQLSI